MLAFSGAEGWRIARRMKRNPLLTKLDDPSHTNRMPRLARIVAPGFPHHVTQRGNRRLRTFFSDGALVRVQPLLERAGDWGIFLAGPTHGTTAELFQAHERTGRPLGATPFIEGLELLLDRPLQPRRPGRRPMSMVQ